MYIVCIFMFVYMYFVCIYEYTAINIYIYKNTYTEPGGTQLPSAGGEVWKHPWRKATASLSCPAYAVGFTLLVPNPPCVSHYICQSAALQELHHNPQLIANKVTVVHVNHVFMMVISHDYNLWGRKRRYVNCYKAWSDTCSDLLFHSTFLFVLSKGFAMNHILPNPYANA